MDFHSVGKTPDTIDPLKMAQRELATRLAHSQRGRALQSLDSKEKNI